MIKMSYALKSKSMRTFNTEQPLNKSTCFAVNKNLIDSKHRRSNSVIILYYLYYFWIIALKTEFETYWK